MKNFVDKVTSNNGNNKYLLIIVVSVIGAMWLIMMIYSQVSGTTTSGTQSGLTKLNYSEEIDVEFHAPEDILEIGNVWGTPSKSELVCIA